MSNRSTTNNHNTSVSPRMHGHSGRKPIKRKKQQLLISQPIHHQQNINRHHSHHSNHRHADADALLHSPPQRKKARYTVSHSAQNHNSQKHTNSHAQQCRPSSIYSQILPLESTQQMQTEYDGRKLINFGCVDYESLVKYCQMFKLHEFEFDYHYDLPSQLLPPPPNSNSNSINEDEIESFVDSSSQRNNAKSARISKEEMSDDNEDEKKTKQHKKRKKRKKKKKESGSESTHFYLNSDALDVHYEKVKREKIPKSFAASTRLTKTELVEIVSAHFLSQPLLAEMSELDVIKQFLLFIQQRRKRLKKEFGLSMHHHVE